MTVKKKSRLAGDQTGGDNGTTAIVWPQYTRNAHETQAQTKADRLQLWRDRESRCLAEMGYWARLAQHCREQAGALAKLHHPDAGGETETMQKINAAFEQLGGAR